MERHGLPRTTREPVSWYVGHHGAARQGDPGGGTEPDPRPVSDHIEIRWPDGRVETRDDVPAGSTVLWAEGSEGSAASTR